MAGQPRRRRGFAALGSEVRSEVTESPGVLISLVAALPPVDDPLVHDPFVMLARRVVANTIYGGTR